MVDKKFGKNVLLVLISNGVKLLLSIASIFLIPILFTKQDYGFYKLFLLYVSYVGFFHFGFIDGIYLYFAGKDYDELDKDKFRAFTKFMLFMELIVAAIIFGVSFFYTKDRQVILILISLNLIALNFTSYFQFISQITNRFKEFALVNIFYTVLNLTLIGSFFIFKFDNYLLFLIVTVLINYILLIWYSLRYRDISFGRKIVISNYKEDISLMFKMGIPLLLSNLVVVMMSNIPKQLVEIKFPVELFPETFSIFSFAFTLIGFTSVFLSAISIVIYPTMKKSDEDTLKKSYSSFNNSILIVIFIALIAYYPLDLIVRWILPGYTDSLDLFFILAPGIALTSSITVIKHNYYKTFNKNKSFLIIGLIGLVLMFSSTYITLNYITNSLHIVTIITVIVQLIWYTVLEIDMQKTIKIRNIKNFIYIIIASSLFYTSYLIDNTFIAMIYYTSLILLATYIFFYKDINLLLKKGKVYLVNKRTK